MTSEGVPTRPGHLQGRQSRTLEMVWCWGFASAFSSRLSGPTAFAETCSWLCEQSPCRKDSGNRDGMQSAPLLEHPHAGTPEALAKRCRQHERGLPTPPEAGLRPPALETSLGARGTPPETPGRGGTPPLHTPDGLEARNRHLLILGLVPGWQASRRATSCPDWQRRRTERCGGGAC